LSERLAQSVISGASNTNSSLSEFGLVLAPPPQPITGRRMDPEGVCEHGDCINTVGSYSCSCHQVSFSIPVIRSAVLFQPLTVPAIWSALLFLSSGQLFCSCHKVSFLFLPSGQLFCSCHQASFTVPAPYCSCHLVSLTVPVFWLALCSCHLVSFSVPDI
jgi:hypothetical protein